MSHPLILVKQGLEAEAAFRSALQVAGIIAHSPRMLAALHMAWRCALEGLSPLLVGPTGCGKDHLARAVHLWSRRAGPLVGFNCGQYTPDRVGVELFGHAKDAYTSSCREVPGMIEAADRGTFLLDEVESLPLEGQVALLRVTETKEVIRYGSTRRRPVDIQLITAAHPDISPRVEDGRFRDDLYHRLARARIDLPSLAERREEIVALAEYFAARMGRGLAASASAPLLRHAWRGNVRELQNAIARAVILQSTGLISGQTMAESLAQVPPRGPRPRSVGDAPVLVTEDFAVRLERVLRKHLGDPLSAAAELGWSRATLYRRLRECGLNPRAIRRDEGLRGHAPSRA